MLWQWSDSVIVESIAAAILLVLAIYFPWRDLNRQARLTGISLVFTCALWTLSHAFEIGLPVVAIKESLLGLQAILGIIAVTFWLFYIFHYLGPRKLLSWRIYPLFGIMPLIAIIALSTNNVYGLMWTGAGLESQNPYLPLQPTYGIIYWACMVYVAVLTLTGSCLIIWSIILRGNSYSRQALSLIVAAVLPLVTAIIEVSGLLSPLLIPVGITPLTACAGAIILIFNLPQFHLEQTLPAARDISFERMGDCILVLDMQDRVLDLNPAAEQLTGYRISDALGLSIEQIWPYPSSQTLPFNKVVSEGEELALERGGKQRNYTLHVYTINDSGGRATSKVVLLTDITERRQAQEALKASEEQLRASLENAPDGVYMNDFEGNFLYGNRRCEEIIGYRREELIGKNFLELNILPGDSLARAAEILQANINGKFTGPDELELIRKDGRRIPVEINTSVVLRGGEKVVLSFVRDITERQKAEAAVRESERRFKSIVEHITDIFFMLDSNREMLYISPQAEKALGYTLEEVRNNWRNYVTDNPINLAAHEKTQLAITTGEKQGPYLQEFMDRNGTKRLIEINESPLKNDKGEIIGIVGAARDVTERKQAEETLKSSEERFAAAFNINPDPTAITMSETGQFVDVNPAYEKWSGFSRDELIGSTSRELNLWVNPADRDAFLNRLRSQGIVEDMEIAFRVRSGELRDTWFTARTAFIGGGEHLLTRAHDITERNLMLATLRDSEEKYRLLVDNAMEAIVIVADGMLKFSSNRTTVLTGYSQEELLFRPFIEFVHPDDRRMMAERYIQRLKGEDVPNIYSFHIVCKSGDIKLVELSAALITWEGKPSTLTFLTDVTDRKRLEEEQQRVAKLESVGLLAGGIAHDFNNILTSVLGNIGLAGLEAQDGSELQNSLEQAEKAVLRAKDLTKQLLTFSKGGAPVTKLASVMELLNDTALFALRGSNVKCQFSLPADLWHAEIDAGQVSQVIHNLVINAQQSMPKGGTIELKAENMALSKTQSLGRGLPIKAGNYIRIAVTDHGSGIAADQLEKIFDPFFTTKQTGSGLGLATSFSIARQHGGHLSVESEVGSGSTFYLYLPASIEKLTHEQDKKEAIKPAGKARILVMDDEKGVREVAGRMLKHLGYQDIEFAADGAAAVKLYKAALKAGHPFGVAILDLTVAGGMGGRETVKKLLKIDPVVKAIVSSGYVDDSVIAEYREYGFSGMVAKPYTLAELGKALQDVIG